MPGSIAALAGYRREIEQERYWSGMLLAPSLLGGLVGSVLMVTLPPDSFKAAVPWLILTAALLFFLQPRIARLTGIGQAHSAVPSRRMVVGAIVFQFFVAIYGGYFGAGIGILMLSALAMIGLEDIHRMNAVKTLLASVINGTSVLVFVAAGTIDWPAGIAMAIASSIGGYIVRGRRGASTRGWSARSSWRSASAWRAIISIASSRDGRREEERFAAARDLVRVDVAARPRSRVPILRSDTSAYRCAETGRDPTRRARP